MPAPPPAPSLDAPAPISAWWFAVPIGLALAAGGYYYKTHAAADGSKSGSPSAVVRAIPVVPSTAKKGDLKLYLTGLGNVTAVYTVMLHSRVDGEITKVLFTEGQTVTAGVPLVEIDTRPFEVQLLQAQGQLQKDQANLENAKVDLTRYSEAKEAISDQLLATQKATIAQIEAACKVDEAAIKAAELQLAYCHISSPIPGKIGLRLVDPGNIVHASDAAPLAIITQVQPIDVVFTLPADDLPRIFQKKDPKGMTVLLYDRDLKVQLAEGKLLTVDNVVDPTTGTVKLKAEFENDKGLLYPNQFVNARLLVETRKDTVIIPLAAVQQSPKSTFVYVIGKDDVIEQRDVKTGPSEGDDVIIEDGVKDGEVVVIEGVDKLTHGAKVTTQKPGEEGDKTTKPAKGGEKGDKGKGGAKNKS
jgi:multidrug efflux system membrane fusion protein